jgi:hypothetical protein
MRLVYSEGPAGDVSPMKRHLPHSKATTTEIALLHITKCSVDGVTPSVHTDRNGQRTTTALDSAKSRAVWQPIRAALQACPVSLGMSLHVNNPNEKEISMGLCPITEYASAWVADPASGLFHDARRAVCSDCSGREHELLALTPSLASADPTHGFLPCARCFGPAEHSSRAGGSK